MEPTEKIKPGLSSQKEFTVKEEHTASHVGSGSVKVLATPMMIAYIEITARDLLTEHLPQGYSSVGTHVNVRHLAASKLGAKVRVTVAVEAVEGSKVSFSTEVWDGEKQVGAGTHERFVIDEARFLKKLES
jgi:fluoroacetyl-CoA thioesterase